MKLSGATVQVATASLQLNSCPPSRPLLSDHLFRRQSPIASPTVYQSFSQLLHPFHHIIHFHGLEKPRRLFNRRHTFLPPIAVRLALAGALCVVRVKHLVRQVPDPVQTLLPFSDDFGRSFEEFMDVVRSFGLAFSRFGPSAQRLFHFFGSFDRLADQFDKVFLRFEYEDAWEACHC